MKKIFGLVLSALAGLVLSAGAGAVTCTSVAPTQTDWNKAVAWDAACGGQPPVGATVIIAAGTSILADAATLNVANITVQAGGTLAILARNTISLSGNFTNYGTFTAPATSTVSLTGTSQTITGNVTFANLNVGTTALTLAGNITVTGTLTGTLNLATTCPTNYTITNGAGTVIGQSCTTPPPLALAEYRMDEASWSGVAGQVTDSSANANNAQSFNSASTASTTPAIAGNPGTCGYGVFDNGGTITQGYVQTPLPNLTSDFTVTAWIRTTNNTIVGQRILIDDQGAAPATGYGISLGDGAAGKIRFYSRGITPVILDSTYTIANNTWYFVAAVADITNKMRTIYVYNATGTLLATTTEAAWSAGAWGTDGGPASIGAETNASAEPPASYHFRGNLDEVAVYNGALTAAQLTAISTKTHACQFGLDHVAISAPANDMAFTATLVTIAPHDAAHAAISNAGTISLSTSTNSGDWTIGAGTGTLTPGAANSGLATYTFGPGETVASLNFTYQTAGTVILYVKDAAGVDLLMNTPVGEKANTITFTLPGYVFTDSACVHNIAFGAAGQTCMPLSWPSQIAGQLFSNIYITDVSPTGVPTRISKNNPSTVRMLYGLSCHNPLAGAGKVPTFSATTNIFPACMPSGATPTVWTTANVASDITFPAGSPSSGPFIFNYPDVGKVELWMKKSGTTSTGSSGAFVVAPHHFVFSGITAAPIKAGNNFSATVTAYNGLATPTPTGNFGQETPAQGVTLTQALVQPTGTGASPGALTTPTFTLYSGGATAATTSWSEVGLITLTATNSNYLGSGLTSVGTSANIGRFIPDHFDTAVVLSAGVPMPCPAGLTCPALYNGFVYSGQPFGVQVTAMNGLAPPTTTRNYDGTTNTTPNFAKGVTLSAVDAKGGAVIATVAPGGTLSATTVLAADFSLGSNSATLANPVFTFATAPTTPTSVFIRASDGEASSLRTINPNSVEGGVAVVSGRVRLANAYGSELLPLTMNATAQYYNGSGWVTSSTDSVTPFDIGAIVPAIVKGPLTVGNLTAGVVVDACAASVFCGGVKKISLNSAKTTGSASICLNSPAYLQGMPACATGTPGPNAGQATFGVYVGSSVFIYRGRHGR